MTANGEEENFNQHRRQSLERLDEIRHRQNRVSQEIKRRDGKRAQRVYAKIQVESFDMFLPETAMTVALLCLGWILFSPWPFVSAVFGGGSFVILAGGLIYRLYKRRQRARLLKDPCEVHFLILKENEGKMDYHPQDSEYHYPDELTLSSNSEREIVIWMKPRLELTMSELQFGCLGQVGVKPEPLYYTLPWVKTGLMKRRVPGER